MQPNFSETTLIIKTVVSSLKPKMKKKYVKVFWNYYNAWIFSENIYKNKLSVFLRLFNNLSPKARWLKLEVTNSFSKK